MSGPDACIDLVIRSICDACCTIQSFIPAESRRTVCKDDDRVPHRKNVHGERISYLDQKAHDVFAHFLSKVSCIHALVSEENCDPIFFDHPKDGPDSKPTPRYWVAVDPLDGSSNIGTGSPVGSIFSVFEYTSSSLALHHPANLRIAFAGYALYGNVSFFVSSRHDPARVSVEAFPPEGNTLIHIAKDVKIPQGGRTYSVNDGNFPFWDRAIQNYVDGFRLSPEMSLRYVGSMVADVHRVLMSGGVFLYPGDKKNPEGKLRLLYEAIPMAFLVENAGGTALSSLDGERVLAQEVREIHQRIPVFFGEDMACFKKRPSL